MWVGFFPIINHPFGVPPFMETPIYDYRCLRPAFVCNSTTSTDWWRTVVKVEKDEPNLVKVEYHHAEPDLQLFSCEKKGVFMSLDSMDLELVWTCDCICHMLHLPTSSNIYHLHSCTKSNIFAIWIIWRFRWAGSFGHRRPESVPKHVELNGPPAKRHWRKLSSEMLQNGIILQSDWMTNDIHLPAPVM